MSERELGTASYHSHSFGTQLDQICDEFEAAWRGGTRPTIEPYWQRAPGLSAELFKELLRLDVIYRGKAGEQPTPDEYRWKV